MGKNHKKSEESSEEENIHDYNDEEYSDNDDVLQSYFSKKTPRR